MVPQQSAWDLIDEVAREIGITEENLRKWHERGGVPPKHRAALAKGLRGRGIVIEYGDDFFERLAPPEKTKRRGRPPSTARIAPQSLT